MNQAGARRLVAVVHLGREVATGERRRVDHWRSLLGAAGAEVVEVKLLADHRRTGRLPRLRDAGLLLNGTIVPETQAWSLTRAAARIATVRPDIVLFVTLRAFHPALGPGSRRILDHVDALSDSYRDRAGVGRPGVQTAGLRALGRLHRRSEERGRDGLLRVAAGWQDARKLRCSWVPNTVGEVSGEAGGDGDVDIGFVGNLGYAPNVEALRTLGAAWPELRRRRPGANCLVAGARPTAEVIGLARQHSWALAADFPDAAAIYRRLRIAVCPLSHASGMQNKVLDAAAHGVPLIVSEVAMRGFAPGLPVTVAGNPGELCARALWLLEHPAEARRQARRAARHVADNYGLARWLPWARDLLSGDPAVALAGPEGTCDSPEPLGSGGTHDLTQPRSR